MAPNPRASSPGVSERMRRTRTSNTPAEIALRCELHRRGLRFRVQRAIAGLPRARPDIVFVSAGLVVFVDGCFWHRCPDHGTDPEANAMWWKAKLDGNVVRDRRVDARLRELGWYVIRVWEHESPDVAADRIATALEERDTSGRRRPS